jgi:hypothetical protein
MKNKYEVALYALGASLVMGLLYFEIDWAIYSINRWDKWNRDLLELFWLTYLCIAPFILAVHTSKPNTSNHASSVLKSKFGVIFGVLRLLYLWVCSSIFFTLFLLLIVSVNDAPFERSPNDFTSTLAIISFTLIIFATSVYLAVIAWRYRHFRNF